MGKNYSLVRFDQWQIVLVRVFQVKTPTAYTHTISAGVFYTSDQTTVELTAFNANLTANLTEGVNMNLFADFSGGFPAAGYQGELGYLSIAQEDTATNYDAVLLPFANAGYSLWRRFYDLINGKPSSLQLLDRFTVLANAGQYLMRCLLYPKASDELGMHCSKIVPLFCLFFHPFALLFTSLSVRIRMHYLSMEQID